MYVDNFCVDNVYVDNIYVDNMYVDSVHVDNVFFDIVYFDIVNVDIVYFDIVYFDIVYFNIVCLTLCIVYCQKVSLRSRCSQIGHRSELYRKVALQSQGIKRGLPLKLSNVNLIKLIMAIQYYVNSMLI